MKPDDLPTAAKQTVAKPNPGNHNHVVLHSQSSLQHGVESVESDFKRVPVERTETFIKEERVD